MRANLAKLRRLHVELCLLHVELKCNLLAAMILGQFMRARKSEMWIGEDNGSHFVGGDFRTSKLKVQSSKFKVVQRFGTIFQPSGRPKALLVLKSRHVRKRR